MRARSSLHKFLSWFSSVWRPQSMGVLWLVPLVVLPTFLLGVVVWVVFEHFLTADIPATLQHRAKLRFLHCVFLYVITLGNILEKLGICSPKFFHFLEDCTIIKKDPKLVVTNLHFGIIPMRLFQPKAVSSSLWQGIIFYYVGGGALGSLDCYHSLCWFLAQETDSVVLSVRFHLYPDHHVSDIFLDCFNASVHFLKTLKTYGVDPSWVIVCGESFGGRCVASITQTLVDRWDLPWIRAQVLICPFLQGINLQLPFFRQYQNLTVLSPKFMLTCMCNCLLTDLSRDAIVRGEFIPPEFCTKYRKWLSPNHIPKRFKKTGYPMVPIPFNEAAYLETQVLFEVGNSPLIVDDETIAKLPEAFLLSCEYDILRDDTLLYKKQLEEQGVPVTWYHVEDGFHGSIILFDKKLFSFPCSLEMVNAVVGYIKGIE
ncbi:LOW QUALITY PROTEIN: arylacetamide deacetylase-like 4 [Dugong dugon]